MKALVIYDSVFGNTEKIAQEIAHSMEAYAQTTVKRIGDMQLAFLTDVDLLIVGSPTRAFRPTPAVKKWMQDLPTGSLNGIKIATFDTRIDPKAAKSWVLNILVNFFGYAAAPIAEGLKKKGGILTASPEGFIVDASEGPLHSGELERATLWANQFEK